MPEGDPQDYLAGIGMLREQMPQFLEARAANALQAPQQSPPPPSIPPEIANLRPPPMPAMPRYQNIPQAPHHEFSDPIKAFQNPAVVLATLGSLFTRAPMTAALNAGGAAMEAFHKGDMQTAELKQKEWEQASKQALEQNKLELEKYKEAWERRNVDVKQKFAEMAALAWGYKDPLINAAVASGNTDILEKILVGREQGYIKGQEAIVRATATAKAQLEAQQLWENDPNTNRVAEAIARYKQAPYTGYAARSPQSRAIMDKVYQINPQYDQGKWVAHQSAERVFASGPEGRLVRSLNVSIDHLATFDELADALKNNNVQAINRIAQRIAAETGNPAPTNFNLAKEIIAKEVVKAIIAGGGGVTERQHFGDLFSVANSPAQLKGAITTAKKFLAGQLLGLRQQYESNGGMDFDAKLTEDARSELNAIMRKPKSNTGPVKVNSPAEAKELDPGTVYVTPDGRQFTR